MFYMTMPAKETKYRVQSVARALSLLEAIAAESEGMTLAEASEYLGISKSAAYSLLQTMLARKFLSEDTKLHTYRLGVAMVHLGDSAVAQLPLLSLARPVMKSLSKQTGLTSRLAQSQDGCPLFLSRVYGSSAVRFQTPLGVQEPAHSTAGGKAILATLSEDAVEQFFEGYDLTARTPFTITNRDALVKEIDLVRQRGFAVDNEEDMEGICCVGAAFSSQGGAFVGALTVTGIKSDSYLRRIDEIGKTIVEHADQLSTILSQHNASER